MQGDFCVGFKIEKVNSLSSVSSVLQEKIMYYQTFVIKSAGFMLSLKRDTKARITDVFPLTKKCI